VASSLCKIERVAWQQIYIGKGGALLVNLQEFVQNTFIHHFRKDFLETHELSLRLRTTLVALAEMGGEERGGVRQQGGKCWKQSRTLDTGRLNNAGEP